MCACFPDGSASKEPVWNAEDTGDSGSISGSGSSLGGGNGNPLQYSCLENPWTGEPDRLQSMRSQRDTIWQLKHNNNMNCRLLTNTKKS